MTSLEFRDEACPHSDEHDRRVSSHRDLRAVKGAQASLYTCHRPGCVQHARVWVQTQTGKPCVIVLLPNQP